MRRPSRSISGFLPNPSKRCNRGLRSRSALLRGNLDLSSYLDDGLHVDGFWLLGELVASTEIALLPGDW